MASANMRMAISAGRLLNRNGDDASRVGVWKARTRTLKSLADEVIMRGSGSAVNAGTVSESGMFGTGF